MENWLSNAVGRSMRPQGAPYNLECTSVPKDYAEHLFGITWMKTINWGHAKDLFFSSFGEYWYKTTNDPNDANQVPKRGDVIVWNSNMGSGYGHIAVVSGVDSTSFTVVEQDGFKNVPAYLKTYKNYSNVIGWLTPKLPKVINQPLGENMSRVTELENDIKNVYEVRIKELQGDIKNVYEPRIESLSNELKTAQTQLTDAKNALTIVEEKLKIAPLPPLQSNNDAIKVFFQSQLSRKYILAIIAASIAFGNAAFNWGLTQDQVILALSPILTWMGFEGFKDIKNVQSN